MNRHRHIGVLAAALLAFSALAALGTWQLQRRTWKLDLIARVDARVHGPPVEAPAPRDWAQVSATRDEYRHVHATGVFQPGTETLVQASTVRGSGFWVMAVLQRADGSLLWVNRGFISADQRDPAAHAAAAEGTVTLTGLLRVPEPTWPFLRHNDPAAKRWYSRDLPAMTAAEGLGRAAPYFIDVEAGLRDSADAPVAGLTVVAFRNNHLVYALTWYTLALMTLGATWVGIRHV